MASEAKDGGPAFPTLRSEVGGVDGMSLRDWFAGQALAGMMACESSDGELWSLTAQNAYFAADAMLKARAALSKAEPPNAK